MQGVMKGVYFVKKSARCGIAFIGLLNFVFGGCAPTEISLRSAGNSSMKMLNILIGVVVAVGAPRMMLAQSPSAQNAIMAVQITKARKANAASNR